MFPNTRRTLVLSGAVGLLFAAAGTRAEEPRPSDRPKDAAVTPEETARALRRGLEWLADPVQSYREALARQRVQNNLRQLSLQLQQLNPPPPLGWQLQILPYIEQSNLYLCPSDPFGGNRLGARVEPVTPTLASQLALPKDHGQVLGEVEKGKAADKAGLKQHDILLKLGGKDVPRDPGAFANLLNEFKADKPVDAVVLREGKRVEVKGLTLPEVKVGATNLLFADPNLRGWEYEWLRKQITDGTSNTILVGEAFARPAAPEGWKVWAKGDPILATTFRQKDRFTTRQQEGSLVLTVVGTVKDGKAVAGGITVREGGAEKKYDALDKVPEEYRDKVAQLLELSAK